MSATVSGPPRQDRVEVEHRVLGMDRRSFPYALSVVAVFLFLTVVVPRVNDAIDWDDPVQAGEQLALTDSLSFTPTAGWNVLTGHRVGQGGSAVSSGEATVVGDGVVLDVVPDDFDGTPAQLLRQVDKVTSSTDDPTFTADDGSSSITTVDGNAGVLQSYRSITGDGMVAAFVIDGTGLKITVHGPPAQMRAAAQDIQHMITSIRLTDASTS